MAGEDLTSRFVSLQDLFQGLAIEIDKEAVAMACDAKGRNKAEDDENTKRCRGFIKPAAHEFLFSIRNSWDWQLTLDSCLKTHLTNAAVYHQFFEEIYAVLTGMVEEFADVRKHIFGKALKGDSNETEDITEELQTITVTFRQWETRLDVLAQTAQQRLLPVHLRTQPVVHPHYIPARALCNYTNSNGFSIRRDEDLLLVESNQRDSWKVRNYVNNEDYVPAITVILPGPFKEAADLVNSARRQLLAEWTDLLKMLGKRLLCHMLLIFRPVYSAEEITGIQSLDKLDRREMVRVLDTVDQSMKTQWAEHEGFVMLQERLLILKTILEEAPDIQSESIDDLYKNFVQQIFLLEKLTNNYQNFCGEWENFKAALEASGDPDMMLIVNNWEQLRYVPKNHLARFWKQNLPLTNAEREITSLGDQTIDDMKKAMLWEDDFHPELVITFQKNKPTTISEHRRNSKLPGLGGNDGKYAGGDRRESQAVPETENGLAQNGNKLPDKDQNNATNEDETASLPASNNTQNQSTDLSATNKNIRQPTNKSQGAEQPETNNKTQSIEQQAGNNKVHGAEQPPTNNKTQSIEQQAGNNKVHGAEQPASNKNQGDRLSTTTTNDLPATISKNQGSESTSTNINQNTEQQQPESKKLDTAITSKNQQPAINNKGQEAELPTTTNKNQSRTAELPTTTKTPGEESHTKPSSAKQNLDTTNTSANLQTGQKPSNDSLDGKNKASINPDNSKTQSINNKQNAPANSDKNKTTNDDQAGSTKTPENARNASIAATISPKKSESIAKADSTDNKPTSVGETKNSATTESGDGASKQVAPPRRVSRQMFEAREVLVDSLDKEQAGKLKPVIKGIAQSINVQSDNDFSSAQQQGTPLTAASTKLILQAQLELVQPKERKMTEAEQFVAVEFEEQQTFVIQSISNPLTNEEISFSEAILRDILRPAEGTYCNPSTGETLSIQEAMCCGLITVERALTRRGRERKSTFGIISVLTVRDVPRPFRLLWAVDTATGERLSADKAQAEGIVDVQRGVFLDKKSMKAMLIENGVEKDMVGVEYLSEKPEPEVIKKVYAVRAVVDTYLKRTLTFQNALQTKIIDKDSGTFRDTAADVTMDISDAIMRGLIKARTIDDPNKLDVDPENTLFIDKTDSI